MPTKKSFGSPVLMRLRRGFQLDNQGILAADQMLRDIKLDLREHAFVLAELSAIEPDCAGIANTAKHQLFAG